MRKVIFETNYLQLLKTLHVLIQQKLQNMYFAYDTITEYAKKHIRAGREFQLASHQSVMSEPTQCTDHPVS